MSLRIGFIGGGQMASALVSGIVKAGLTPISNISVCDLDSRMTARHKAAGAFTTTKSSEVISRSDVVVLAIKPHIVPFVLRDIKKVAGAERVLFISIAAGFALEKLQAGLPAGARVIRVMPNTPALVGFAAASYCCGKYCTPQDDESAKAILGAVGKVWKLTPKLVDASTGLSGSGPAYVYMMIEALADGGVHSGLPRDVALEMAAQTVIGSGQMVLKTGKHPGELKDNVCSPGGTTIEAVRSLEKDGFRSAVIHAVIKANKRLAKL